jgi:hypothetical protein
MRIKKEIQSGFSEINQKNKMKKIPTVYELRRQGYKVRVTHIRKFHRFDPRTGKKTQFFAPFQSSKSKKEQRGIHPDAVKNVGVSLGTSLKNQVSMATSAAGLGAMYGSSADDVLTMSKSFRLMDKSSAEQAINMTAGLKSYARMNDMSPAQLFKEMADFDFSNKS